MGCATGTVKIIVFTFNFLCSIVGLLLITIGAIAISGLKNVDHLTNLVGTGVPTSLIVLGVSVFIISFLGCCGVYQRSQCMLILYSAILILLFVLELAAGIYGYTLVPTDDASQKENFTHVLESEFKNYTRDNDTRTMFNEIQLELQCCGVNGYRDYESININARIPGTCCGLAEREPCVAPPTYTDGCANKMYEVIQHYMRMASYVILGICITELVGAIFAICLVNSYKNEDRRGN